MHTATKRSCCTDAGGLWNSSCSLNRADIDSYNTCCENTGAPAN